MPLIERADSRLVVIDAQEGFYGADRTDVDRAVLDNRLATAAWIVGVAVALDVPVVVTEEDAPRNGPTDSRIRERLAVGTPVLDKATFAAPDNPAIASAVAVSARGTVILIGLETDVCVGQSALQFQTLGRRVVVVHDATFAPGNAHQHGLGRLERAGIELVSAKELFYDWLRTLAAVRTFCADHPELEHPPGFSL